MHALGNLLTPNDRVEEFDAMTPATPYLIVLSNDGCCLSLILLFYIYTNNPILLVLR